MIVAQTPIAVTGSTGRLGSWVWQVDPWVSTYVAIAAGELATVAPDIPEVTGHPATSLQQAVAAGGGAER
jgi:NAD(P)H dehydrogenase (quinone)